MRKRMEILTCTFRSFDDNLLDRYPKAKCPTENIESSFMDNVIYISCVCVYKRVFPLLVIKSV